MEALFYRYFKLVQPIKLTLNIQGLPVCEAVILRVTVNIIEVFSSFYVNSDDFWLKVPIIAKKGT